MDDSQLTTIDQIRDFLNSVEKIDFKAERKREVYTWTRDVLIRLRYAHKLSKKDKGLVKKYIERVTGYSRAQVTRLVGQFVETGKVKIQKQRRYKFQKTYTSADVELFARTDSLHDFPNGNTLRSIFTRAFEVFGSQAYKRLAKISVGHIYNIRNSTRYQQVTKNYKKTQPSVVNIGERRKPKPEGKPGYIRVDSVHQGDQDGTKGVYHINMIDEVTQAEFVGSAERLTEEHMVPLLEEMLSFFWFPIVEVHSDNGSEYINRNVSRMLDRLVVKLTKSRARQTNDNALVEGKNGSIIRKWLGYGHIKQTHADQLNRGFWFGCLNEYVNFHRPCAHARVVVDKKGKMKKVYRLEDYQTPYEKFKSLKDSKQFLKPGMTFKELDELARRYTDNEMAQIVQDARAELFENIMPD